MSWEPIMKDGHEDAIIDGQVLVTHYMMPDGTYHFAVNLSEERPLSMWVGLLEIAKHHLYDDSMAA